MASMLDEQKRINEELLGQMKQMQYQMKLMTNMSQQGMNNMMGEMGSMSSGRGGPGSLDRRDRNFGFRDRSDFGGIMGSDYGCDFGGGKMGGGLGGSSGRPIPYNMRVPKQVGDWDCPQCGNMNFARRFKCNGEGGTCQVEKMPEFIRRGTESPGGPTNRRPGDWDCVRCGNMNYARRNSCNKCQSPKEMMGMMEMGGGFGMQAPGGWTDGPTLETRPGDWKCLECANVNFSRREKCNKCDKPKKEVFDNSFNGGINFELGDWECPRCGNLNKAANAKCNGVSDGEPCWLLKPHFEEYGVPLIKEKTMTRPGDWNCFQCGNINFKIREECNKCKLSKSEAISDNFRDEGNEEIE